MYSNALGVLLALGCAAFFGANNAIIRRGVMRASVNYISLITICVSPFFFLLVSAISGEIFKLGQMPWQAYAWFAVAGVVNFALGRTLNLRTVQLIGSTRTNTVVGLFPILSAILAVIVLKESVTLLMALGIVLSLSGPALITLKERTIADGAGLMSKHGGKEVDRRTLYLGMIHGLSAVMFLGTAPIFIKLALESGGSPIVGTLIAFTSATVAITPSLLKKSTRQELRLADPRALRLALMSSFTSCVAQLFRYSALAHATVITVGMMERTYPIWVLLLAFIFNRKLESFSRWVLLGNGLIVVGSVLVIM